MSRRFDNQRHWFHKIAILVAFVGTAMSTCLAHGQFGTNFVQTVGGIRINTDGVLELATEQMASQARDHNLKLLGEIDAELQAENGLRAISLKAIEAALKHSSESGEVLPDEIKFMAGIQRLEYLYLDEANHDVILAGPGEAWTVDQAGNVVGTSTGRPVIRLEDFLVALRTANNANRDLGISVSIDPTDEGIRKAQGFLAKLKRQRTGFGPKYAAQLEKAFGPQQVSLTGVPTNSRYANVLLAADFQMKRIAMHLEQSPIASLSSVLEIAKQRRDTMNIAPRFWLECNYHPLKKSEDGLIWHLSGPGAKALTQEMALLDGGAAKKSHPVAEIWAEQMTNGFAELAQSDIVFGELRNILDMSVIAALVEKEQLFNKVELQAPLLTGKQDSVKLPAWQTPKTVPSFCSYTRVNGTPLVTVSGGIQVDSWEVLSEVEIDETLAEVQSLIANNQAASKLYWNIHQSND